MKESIIICLLSILTLSFLHAHETPQTDTKLIVISYNIRYDNPADGINSWEKRKDMVISLLKFYDAEIFCLQEALFHQVNYIDSAFADYGYYGPCRDDGKIKGEACPIFYSKQRFTLIESGTFWYAETPEIPGSIDWDANLPRIASWLILHDQMTNRDLLLTNTHFDHESQLSRSNSAKLLKEKLTAISNGLPVIVCGDFNAYPDSEPFQILVEGGRDFKLSDTRRLSQAQHHGPDFTYIGFDFIGNNGDIIDYVFTTQEFAILKHAYLTDNLNGVFPSDHLPVFVELEIKN